MNLENIKEPDSKIDSKILESLEGAKIIAGANYDLNNENCYGLCQTCNCVCNQPCHGEGPCYKL